MGAVDAHAGHFLGARVAQIRDLRESMNVAPIVLSPFDAELFGHWWFEGPEFLNLFIRKAAYDQDAFAMTTPTAYLAAHDTQQIVAPSPSSWGHMGYWEVWLDDSNSWIYPHLHIASSHRRPARSPSGRSGRWPASFSSRSRATGPFS
jgi:1,4-alpha-glucan branching enzyme